MMVAQEENDLPQAKNKPIYWNHGTIYPLNNRRNLLRTSSMKLRSCSLSWVGTVIRIVKPL